MTSLLRVLRPATALPLVVALAVGPTSLMVDLAAPSLAATAHAAGGAPAGGDAHGGDAHGGDSHGGGAHHAGGPWEDDNHNGVANFFDAQDDHYANSWGHPVYLQWIFHALNLAVLIGVLVWFGRKGVQVALRDRSTGIRAELEDAASVHAAAQARHAELERRLSGFEAEVAGMKAEAARALDVEKRAAMARADEAATRIRDAAQRAIRDEAHRATRTLRAEAVQLAVQLAERTLTSSVDDGDKQRLAAAFLDSLRTDGARHG